MNCSNIQFSRGYVMQKSGQYRQETDAEFRERILANDHATPGLFGPKGLNTSKYDYKEDKL